MTGSGIEWGVVLHQIVSGLGFNHMTSVAGTVAIVNGVPAPVCNLIFDITRNDLLLIFHPYFLMNKSTKTLQLNDFNVDRYVELEII